jgi:hypothetical protein
MIHQHLQRRALVAPPVVANLHLDDDALSAFVEGRLSEQESVPVIQHLVGCGFCRRITVQLVRLDSELGPAEEGANTPPPQEAEEPGRIRRLLDDLASRVLPPTEADSVFAYHAPAEDFKRRGETASEEPAEEEGADESAGGEKQDDKSEQ